MMEHDQDSSCLLRNLLAHLKHEVQLYGTAAPTPCKHIGQPRAVKVVQTPESAPQPGPRAQHRDDVESEALNNGNAHASCDVHATIVAKVSAKDRPADTAGRAVIKTPWSGQIHDSPMQVEQFTGMARASLIDDLSDSSWTRCTPKRLVYSDSPCKDLKDAPSPVESFSFDVAGCSNMLDSVGLAQVASGPATPYIGAKAESPMDTSPTPAKCSVQELQELSNMLIQERAEKLALAAYNQQLMEELIEMKKGLAISS